MPGQKRALHQDRAGDSAPREPRYFLVSGGFGWPVDEANRLASGLRELQSAWRKRDAQEIWAGLGKPYTHFRNICVPGIDVNDDALYLCFGREVLQLQFLAGDYGFPQHYRCAVGANDDRGSALRKRRCAGLRPGNKGPSRLWLRTCMARAIKAREKRKGGTRRKIRRASLRSSASRCVLLDPPQIASTCQGESLASV